MIEARRTTASSSGMTDTIKIDFAAIPDYVREELAEATLESVRAARDAWLQKKEARA